MDSILLRGLVTNSLIGVYPSEQTLRQPLRLDLTLLLDTNPASATDRLGHTIDYGKLAGELRFILEAARFSLLESAAQAIAAYVLAPPLPALHRVAVDAAIVELSKTQQRNTTMTPTVRIERNREQIQIEVEERPFGKVDVIYTCQKCGIYRLRVGPGLAIPAHVHRVMEESEMILTEGVLLQGRTPELGSVRKWPIDFPHKYENPTTEEQVVLCVDRPRFLPEDEVPVDVPDGELRDMVAENFYGPQIIDP